MITRLDLLRFLALTVAALFPPGALAAGGDNPPEATMKGMMEAIKTKSYDAFVANGDPTLRAIPRRGFEELADIVGPRLRQGYKTHYLVKIHRRDADIFLWKVEFADGGEEALMKIYIKERKVARFFIQPPTPVR